MQPGEKQLGEMQLGEMQHFNTTPLVEIQPGEMQFGEMQLSHIILYKNCNYKILKRYDDYRNNNIINKNSIYICFSLNGWFSNN
ncbi:hypothetical protein H8356DRAFT_1406047 [Neocallimastix lanati (nom. inval.)]|nr:hypothetical protein H8356DRAFT_1406047 [Neocallimastix sp. JGI-2020a]